MLTSMFIVYLKIGIQFSITIAVYYIKKFCDVRTLIFFPFLYVHEGLKNVSFYRVFVGLCSKIPNIRNKRKKVLLQKKSTKCGIPQNEISHQKQDISSHMNYISSWLHIRAISCCLSFLIIYVSWLRIFLNDWKFVVDSQGIVHLVHDTLTIPGNAI